MRRLVYKLLTLLFRVKEFVTSLSGFRDREAPITVNYYPLGLGIEVTNLCNANCVFCAYQYRRRPVTFMSQETFEKAINQYVSMDGGGGGIGLTPVVGDTLIDQDLVRKIAYARSFPQMKHIHIITNGILLTQELFERLVDRGLTGVTVSMSGFDEEEYQRIYRKPSYKKVIANLRAIARSDRFKKCRADIALRTDGLFPWLKKEYWEFRNLGFHFTRTMFFDSWSGQIRDRDLNSFMFLRPERRSKHIPCQMLYLGPHVMADGTVTACGCRDLEGTSELRLGNIHETSLREMTQGGKLEVLRRRFLQGDLPDVCKDCTFYVPISPAHHKQHSKVK